MRLIVDTREQRPYSFEGPRYDGVTIERCALNVGDYSLAGLTDKVSVERKSVDDLAQSVARARERFERELQRAQALDAFCVVVEGTYEQIAKGLYGPRVWPKAILQSLCAFTARYGTPFFLAGSRTAAEYVCFSFLRQYLEGTRRRLDAIVNAHDMAENRQEMAF